MEIKDVMLVIADVHNKLLEIFVRGEDAIRMAECLQTLRQLVTMANEEAKNQSNLEDAE